MMKCGTIQDLLPLYVDDVCSEDSRALVEEHVERCQACKRKLDNMQSEIAHKPTPNPDSEADAQNAAQVGALRTFKRKLRRKHIGIALVSVFCVMLLVVCVFRFVLMPQTPIPYEEGLLNVEVNTTKYAYDEDGNPIVITEFVYAVTDDGSESYSLTIESDSGVVEFGKEFVLMPQEDGVTLENREVIDITSSRNTACRNATNFIIEENGERVNLVFVNFTENLLSKLEPGGETLYAFRVVEPQSTSFTDDKGNRTFEEYDRIEVYYVDHMLNTISIDSAPSFSILREEGTLLWRGTLQ